MSGSPEYTTPKVWTWNKASGGRFANINRPIAGPTSEKDLPVGRHPLQLYSLATPNGVNRRPSRPGMANSGTKTRTMTIVA